MVLLVTRASYTQELATSEKTVLEEEQRTATKWRLAHNETWVPRCFEADPVTDTWHYRHADVRPWDQRNDVVQYESKCVIATKTRHRTPMIREASIVSVERQVTTAFDLTLHLSITLNRSWITQIAADVRTIITAFHSCWWKMLIQHC